MATFTTRLQATKAASSENVDVTTHLNNNYDLFDSAVGATVGTSAARPASAFSGRLWWESDTGKLRINRAASASTAAIWGDVRLLPLNVGERSGIDLTGVVDSGPAIQAQLDAASVAGSAGSALLMFPTGKLMTNQRLTLKIGVTCVGHGGADNATRPSTEIFAGPTLAAGGAASATGDIFHYPASGANIWNHAGIKAMRISGAGRHGIYIEGGLGETTVIDEVMLKSNTVDGLRIAGSSTPGLLGHISVHNNGGAGVRLETQSETHTQIEYLAGDNNGTALLHVNNLGTKGTVRVLGWKSERWDSGTPGHPNIFLLDNLNGGLVDLGMGRVSINTAASTAPNAVVRQSSGIGRVEFLFSYNKAVGSSADYTYAYEDATNGLTYTITELERRRFSNFAAPVHDNTGISGVYGHMTFGKSGPGVYSGSASPNSLVTAGVGSIYLRSGGAAGTSFYVKESGAGDTGWVGK